jgi:hypothetical protein
MQLHLLEPLQHLEQQPCLVELTDGVVEVELLQHLPDIGAEAGDVVPEVGRQMGGVGEELLEVVARGVVEGEAGRPPELRVEVLESLALQFGLTLEDPVLGAGQHAVEASEHGERKDDVLVLASLKGVPDQVRHAPQEADDLAVVHSDDSLVWVPQESGSCTSSHLVIGPQATSSN